MKRGPTARSNPFSSGPGRPEPFETNGGGKGTSHDTAIVRRKSSYEKGSMW